MTKDLQWQCQRSSCPGIIPKIFLTLWQNLFQQNFEQIWYIFEVTVEYSLTQLEKQCTLIKTRKLCQWMLWMWLTFCVHISLSYCAILWWRWQSFLRMMISICTDALVFILWSRWIIGLDWQRRCNLSRVRVSVVPSSISRSSLHVCLQIVFNKSGCRISQTLWNGSVSDFNYIWNRKATILIII